MRDVSQTFLSILNTGRYRTNCRADIGGVSYLRDKLVSMEISASLFGEGSVKIGQASAATISLQIYDRGDNIPRMAEIKPYIQLIGDDGQESEWLQKGLFYIDTRKYNERTGVLSLTGYDGLKKADVPYLKAEQSNWNKKTSAVLQEICTRIGTELDPRSTFPKQYSIPYPDAGESGKTIREVLQGIAAMYGGNWCMTDLGKLRLIRLNTLPEATNYLSDSDGGHILVGGVHIHV